jgi:protein-arginine kinase activator protein McsA
MPKCMTPQKKTDYERAAYLRDEIARLEATLDLRK